MQLLAWVQQGCHHQCTTYERKGMSRPYLGQWQKLSFDRIAKAIGSPCYTPDSELIVPRECSSEGC